MQLSHKSQVLSGKLTNINNTKHYIVFLLLPLLWCLPAPQPVVALLFLAPPLGSSLPPLPLSWAGAVLLLPPGSICYLPPLPVWCPPWPCLRCRWSCWWYWKCLMFLLLLGVVWWRDRAWGWFCFGQVKVIIIIRLVFPVVFGVFVNV